MIAEAIIFQSMWLILHKYSYNRMLPTYCFSGFLPHLFTIESFFFYSVFNQMNALTSWDNMMGLTNLTQMWVTQWLPWEYKRKLLNLLNCFLFCHITRISIIFIFDELHNFGSQNTQSYDLPKSTSSSGHGLSLSLS